MSEADLVLSVLQKQHGVKFGSKGGSAPQIARIPTGIFQLDFATGGGFPEGKISIVYGMESSGKTSVTHLACRTVQSRGKKAVVIALEPYDSEWATKLGVKVEDMYVLWPDTAEQAVDAVEAMLYADDVGLVVLDSIGQMTPSNEVESDAEKQIVGGASALCGKLVRKAGVALTKEEKRGHRPALVLVNQIRHKIGVMFGDPETTPGGNQLRFSSSLSLRLYAKDVMIKDISEELPTFRHTTGTIKKWKVPIVGKHFEYDFALIPHDGLHIGDAPSWNTVATHLKSHGLLVKDTKGWKCCGEAFDTLGQIEAQYNTTLEVRFALQNEVISRSNVIPVQFDTKGIIDK